MSIINARLRLALIPALTSALLAPTLAMADGVVPESSLLIIDAGTGEGTMNVRNDDTTPLLLHSTVRAIKEDDEDIVFITNPTTRVEPGKAQQVRFLLRDGIDVPHERLRRVTFEGVKPKKGNDGASQVSFSVIQDIPMIIRPAGLAKDVAPWKHLEWQIDQGSLHAHNPSPYVVRLANQVALIPSGTPIDIETRHILPGGSLSVALPDGSATGQTGVTIVPGTTYGYQVDSYDAALLTR